MDDEQAKELFETLSDCIPERHFGTGLHTWFDEDGQRYYEMKFVVSAEPCEACPGFVSDVPVSGESE